MLAVSDLELRVGARLLLQDVSFRVERGDKVGLVGRNGAGKTTLTRMLAGEGGVPAGGSIERRGEIGYLPQDPRSGDPDSAMSSAICDATDSRPALTACKPWIEASTDASEDTTPSSSTSCCTGVSSGMLMRQVHR